jgi:hypothetical protein
VSWRRSECESEGHHGGHDKHTDENARKRLRHDGRQYIMRIPANAHLLCVFFGLLQYNAADV